MSLTEGQRRQLDELAGELARENPRLARALAGRRYLVRRRYGGSEGSRGNRRRLDWLVVALTAAAAPLLIIGFLLALPVLIALGVAALVSLLVRFTAARPRPPAA